MKKILAITFCLLIAVFAVGCTFTPSTNLTMDANQPWTFSDYEQCVYKVVKRNAKGELLGEGTLTNTARVDSSKNQTTVSSEFTFLPYDALTPVPDTITSSATFENTNCFTIKSEKNVVLNSSPDLNYRFVADYENDRKVEYFTNGTAQATKTLTVPSSEKKIYDNEALYYITRAFNPENEKEGNFLLTNLYDCYTENRISSYSVYYRASSVFITDEIFDEMAKSAETDKPNAWKVMQQNDVIVDNKVECYHAKINRNRANMSGAPVEMWFSKKAFVGGNKRVMVKMRTTTLTIPDANLDYTMEYDLITYSTQE